MPSTSGHRPTWAAIDLDNLAFNFHSSKKFIGDVEYMAVVKADAYGHGAIECARRLEAEGVDWLGVAIVEEGIELRRAGIDKPILCLGGCWPGQEGAVVDHKLAPVVFRVEQAERLNNYGASHDVRVPVHVKIDTGMGRLGIRFDEAAEFADTLRGFTNLEIEGMMTHFAVADRLDETDFTELQIKRFDETVSLFRECGFDPKYLDLANSPGAVAHPSSRSRMVRLGGILYGLGGDVLPAGIDKPELKPVMSVHTEISLLKNVPAAETLGYGRTFRTERDSVIATIPIGYHDGLSRSLSNKGKVIVNGRLAPIVGRISMDWTIIDVTDVPDVEIGSKVTIIGTQGDTSITAEEIAAMTGTISYEVTCSVDRRARRIYST